MTFSNLKILCFVIPEAGSLN